MAIKTKVKIKADGKHAEQVMDQLPPELLSKAQVQVPKFSNIGSKK